MKRILIGCILLWGVVAHAVPEGTVQSPKKAEVTRGDVKIIEATESIRYLSQKMAKEYLYICSYPQNAKIKKNLHDTLAQLGKSLQTIAAMTKDEDTNNILEFLVYSKEEILTLLKKKPSSERALLMLDYSETLLEGADSIGQTYAYTFSKEEEMLVASKNVKYLLERISKYYMVLYQGYNTDNNKKNMESAVSELLQYMAKINSYSYPKDVAHVREKIDVVWFRDKEILQGVNRYFIPNLLLDSVVYLEDKVDVLALYHSQNL